MQHQRATYTIRSSIEIQKHNPTKSTSSQQNHGNLELDAAEIGDGEQVRREHAAGYLRRPRMRLAGEPPESPQQGRRRIRPFVPLLFNAHLYLFRLKEIQRRVGTNMLRLPQQKVWAHMSFARKYHRITGKIITSMAPHIIQTMSCNDS
jgi:hypothetical protein